MTKGFSESLSERGLQGSPNHAGVWDQIEEFTAEVQNEYRATALAHNAIDNIHSAMDTKGQAEAQIEQNGSQDPDGSKQFFSPENQIRVADRVIAEEREDLGRYKEAIGESREALGNLKFFKSGTSGKRRDYDEDPEKSMDYNLGHYGSDAEISGKLTVEEQFYGKSEERSGGDTNESINKGMWG